MCPPRFAGAKVRKNFGSSKILGELLQGNHIYYPTRRTVRIRIPDGTAEMLLTTDALSAAEEIWRVA